MWDPVKQPTSSASSLIIWQGPFHVSLNAQESMVLLFRPVFEKLYKKLFGRDKMAHKPPPDPIDQRKLKSHRGALRQSPDSEGEKRKLEDVLSVDYMSQEESAYDTNSDGELRMTKLVVRRFE
ncbi:hypothetical protein OS493_000385 [Desmophyllum pertusum]|uniref:Uncharacterized protein n=1 Tax=Desmophyllum pertusum TaxID=174260 RepID=A0A9X0AAM7_9CNID|nr:hypothetical protein OS493_000385 [Desmophyllum pertusum]